MSKRRWIPYVLSGISAAVVIIMLSPIVAPENKYKPFILGLPYTVIYWAVGSVVISVCCTWLGIWALQTTMEGDE